MSEALPWWKRIGWMLAIWTASVAIMFVVAGLLRVILKP